MNNFKITILFSLIVFIFVLDHLASAEENVAIKYERVRQLIALTDQLETIFYSAGEMDSASYAAYTQACEELIDLHISLGKQCNEKQFTEMAFAYLEKVKSQRLLKLFIPAVAPASLRTTLLRLLEKNQMLSRQYFVLRNKLLFEKVDKDSIQLALRNIANSMNNFWSSIQSNEPQLSLFLILQTPITPVYLQKYCLK